MADLLQLNPGLDRAALAAQFAKTGRVQIRNVLTADSAATLRALLAEQTPWCLAWQAGPTAPAQLIPSSELATFKDKELAAIRARAAEDPDYGFVYHSYPLVRAYLERWNPGAPQERLLEELNSPPMLDFVREITRLPEIAKMDGQATLYAPDNFLRPHTDEESQRGRLVAYVLNLTQGQWLPEWGGSLIFAGNGGRPGETFLPTFNSLSLFRVPQWHEVSRVTASAPVARYAVTGWARDR